MKLKELVTVALLVTRSVSADSSSSASAASSVSITSAGSSSSSSSLSSSISTTTLTPSSASSSQSTTYSEESISSSNSSITTTSGSSSSGKTSMPSITATTESSIAASSSYNGTYSAIVPTGYNPYVQHDTLPSGLPFVVVGAFFGLVLFSLIVSRFFMWCVSYRQTKKDHDEDFSKDEYNYDPTIFKETSMKKNYTQSIYSLSSQSTINVLGSNASLENLVTQGQGRSYRQAVTRASRGSLFISPTEMLQLGTYDPSAAGYLSHNESPIDSPITPTGNYTPADYKRKTSRPPSVYMDKMLDGDLDDFDISSDGSSYSYDRSADEKV